MKDVSLEIDGFSRNKIISDATAMAMQLYNLLNMVPGDDSSDPDKGIDMKQYRVGVADESATSLKEAIQKQVSNYCDFETSEVEVIYKDGELVVGIKSPSFAEIMIFQTDNDNLLLSIIES